MNDTAVTTESNLPKSGAQSERGVHELGYRGWSGWQVPGWMRFIVIGTVGARRAWQNLWLKRMLFFAWGPAVGFGACIFLWEQAALYPEWRQLLMQPIEALPRTPVFEQIKHAVHAGDFNGSRHSVWAWLLNCFIRYPQSVLAVLVVGLIAPSLISQDIRSRAFLLYFSRPLTRTEYILGKMATIWVYLGMISIVPSLFLYMIGILLSPNLSVIFSTWDLPLRIAAASVVLMLPTSAMALCFSSLTQESRYAAFAWFAVWILGWFTYATVSSAETFRAQQEFVYQHQMNRHAMHEAPPIVDFRESPWTHLSLYHTLGRAQSWVFGFTKFKDVLPSLTILLAVTVISLLVLFRRISAPMRV